MKRWLSLLLTLCLALCCGLSAASASGEELEPATLTVWLGGPGAQADSDMVFAAFNEQLQDDLPNTTVDFLPVPFSEYSEKWSKAMAAGESIDVAWFGWVLNINNEVSMGSLTPLNDLIDQYAPDLVEELGQNVIDAHSIDGVIYAVPCWQGLAGAARCDIQLKGDTVDAMSNENYVDELEATIAALQKESDLQTRYEMFYDKYEEYLQSALDTDTLGLGYFDFGMISFMHDKEGITDWIYVNGGDDTFTLQSDIIDDSDAFNLTLYQYSRLQDYWQKGFFRDDYLTCDMDVNFGGGDPTLSWVADISTVTIVNTKASLGAEASDARASAAAGFDVRTVSGGDAAILGKGYSTSTVIPYTSKNPERAMMYINLLNSSKGAELYHTLVYGVEGTHYSFNDEGRIVLAGGDGSPDSSWAYGQYDWAVGTRMNSLLKVGEVEGLLEKAMAYDHSAVVLPLYNFDFDPTNVDMEMASVEAIMKEYKYLYCYEDYEARLRERNAKLMAAGFGDIMDEVQAQLDVYLENNDVSWPEY